MASNRACWQSARERRLSRGVPSRDSSPASPTSASATSRCCSFASGGSVPSVTCALPCSHRPTRNPELGRQHVQPSPFALTVSACQGSDSRWCWERQQDL